MIRKESFFYAPDHASDSLHEGKESGEVSIRPYQDPDCKSVVTLMRTNFEGQAFSLYPKDVVNAYRAANSEADVRHAVKSGGTEAFVAETGQGELAGFLLIRFNPNQIPRRNAYGELDLRRLHVNPAIQGQGVGRKLFDTATARARALNIEYITSHASGSSRPYFEHNGWTGRTILNDMRKRKTSAIVFAAERRVAPPQVDLFAQPTHVVYAGSNKAKAAHLQSIAKQTVVPVESEENDSHDVHEAARSKAISAAQRISSRGGHVPIVVANDIRTDILVLNPPQDTTRYSFLNRGKPQKTNGGIDEILVNFKLMLEYARATQKPAPYVTRSATYLHNPLEPDADTSSEQDVSVWLSREGLEVLATSQGLQDYQNEVYGTFGIDITQMAAGFALPVFLQRGYVAGLYAHPLDTLPSKDAYVKRAIDTVIGGFDERVIKQRLGILA